EAEKRFGPRARTRLALRPNLRILLRKATDRIRRTPMKRFTKRLLTCFCVAAIAPAFLYEYAGRSATAQSGVTVPGGFTVGTYYAGAPLAKPSELKTRADGALIVADVGAGIGDCATSDGAVYAIAPDRSVTTLVSGNALQEPGGLAFGNGNAWG